MLKNYDDVLTVDQMMEILYIGRNTAYKLLKSGSIKAFRIGRSWRISRNSLEKFISGL